MDVCEKRSWSFYVPQSPFSWIVTGTCIHFKERGYLLLHFCDYLLSVVFSAIRQILRSRSHRLQNNQPKTRENYILFVLPSPGIESRTFQLRVYYCLAIWAIPPRFPFCILSLYLTGNRFYISFVHICPLPSVIINHPLNCIYHFYHIVQRWSLARLLMFVSTK